MSSVTAPGIADHFSSLRKGAKASGCLRAGTMASGQPIALPYMIARGLEDGQCLWLNGAVHGDEINGSLAAIDFFSEIDPQRLRGSVVVTPVSNPLGFDARRKRVPQDEQDLDQTFPGRPDGLTSEIVAHLLFKEIDALADTVVNFHTMMPYFASRPYAVYKNVGGEEQSEEALLRAMALFGPVAACRMNVTPTGNELPGNIAGALDYQCLKRGKLAFMIELGIGSRQEPAYIRQGVEGLRRLVAHMGLSPSNRDAEAAPGGVRRVTRRTHVLCREGGLFRQGAQPGDKLPAGELLGRIHSACGDTVEEIRFNQDVIVIGVRNDPVVHTGDRVGFVALEWDDVTFS